MLDSGFDKHIKKKLEGFNLDVNPSKADIASLKQNLPANSGNKLTNRLLYIAITLLLLFLFLELFKSNKRSNTANEIVVLQQQVDSLFNETRILANKLEDSSNFKGSYSNGLSQQIISKLRNELLDSLNHSAEVFDKKSRNRPSYYSASKQEKSNKDIVSMINKDLGLQKKLIASLLNNKEIQSSLTNIVEQQKTVINTEKLSDSKLTNNENIKESNEILSTANQSDKNQSDSLKIEKLTPDTIFIVDQTQAKPIKTPIPINWFVGGGTGIGFGNLEIGGNVVQIPINGYVECLIGSHFSIISGLEFTYINAEKKPPFDNVELTKFSNLPFSNIEDAEEFKIKLIYLDIPIELRCYILPKKKINPFVSLGFQSRLLIKDQYEFEVINNNEETYISTGKSVTQMNIGGIQFGTGLRFDISNNLHGTVGVNYLQGFENLGSINNQLNSVGLDFTLLYHFK